MSAKRDDVLAAMTGRYNDFYSQFTPLKPSGGEMRGSCPIHQGDGPSFTVNPEDGSWYCHSGCQGGGGVFDFIERLKGISFAEALAQVAAFAGISEQQVADRTPARSASPAPKHAPTRYSDANIAEHFHLTLMNNDKVRRWLSDHRGLTMETLKRFQVGLVPPAVKGEEWRITFPVYDRQGRLTNIRKHLFAYKPDLTDERRRELGKTLPWEKGLTAGLFPLSVLDGAHEALIVEGEADALLACQMGFAAVTGTGGAGTWHDRWSEELRSCQRVTILYDSDQTGQDGAQKVAASVYHVVPDVRIASYSAWAGKEGIE